MRNLLLLTTDRFAFVLSLMRAAKPHPDPAPSLRVSGFPFDRSSGDARDGVERVADGFRVLEADSLGGEKPLPGRSRLAPRRGWPVSNGRPACW